MNRDKKNSASCSQIEPLRADGGGRSYFTATPHPVVEYSIEEEIPVVRRVNPAYRETFEIEESLSDQPIASLSVFSLEDADQSPILQSIRNKEENSFWTEKEKNDAAESFWVRVDPADYGGFIIFSDAHNLANTPNRVKLINFISHSINNPLEVAKVNVELVRDTGNMNYLKTVERAHERIQNIAEETCELVEQGEVIGETSPTDVTTLAQDAWETVNTGESSLLVESPGKIQADAGRLKELFENIFRNAVVHGSGDEITQSELTVTVDGTVDGFYVADNGGGVPEDKKDKITEMGFTTHKQGTGVGLSIVVDIAESHGWDVSIKESVGGGARFDFTGVQRVD